MSALLPSRELSEFRHRKVVRPKPIAGRGMGKRLMLLAKDPRPKSIEQMLSILSRVKTASPHKLLAAVAGEDERFGAFFDPSLTPSEQSYYLRTKYFSELASLGLFYHEGKGALLPVTHSFSLGNAKGFLLEDSSALGEFDGSTFGGRILLSNLSEHMIQHELQHVFDGFFGLGRELGSREYRAELASLAFSESETSEILQSFLSKSRYPEDPESVYVQAASRIITELSGKLGTSWEKMHSLSDDADFLSKVREAALEMLDEVYLETVGFSYKKIISCFSSG